MGKLVDDYLTKRRALGFALRSHGAYLQGFARYADRYGHRGPLTLKLAVRWARLPKNASPSLWACRFASIRPFAKYQAALDPRTEIPPTGYFGPAHRRPTPHIYSRTEIRALIGAARRLHPRGGLRPLTYATLLGLLACTGLRISEALRLRQADVDLHQGVITVRQSKFKQSRLVPLHPSAVTALRRYSRARDQQVAAEHCFASQSGQALRYCTVWLTFRSLVSRGLGNHSCGGRLPRIHDMRHTFATLRLLQWIREGTPPDYAVLLLSRYLGHQQVSHTYWYLSGVPELFSQVGHRFERFAREAKL
jgi:integrase